MKKWTKNWEEKLVLCGHLLIQKSVFVFFPLATTAYTAWNLIISSLKISLKICLPHIRDIMIILYLEACVLVYGTT